MSESPLKQLVALGQSPWLDFIQRSMLASGELERMIDEWAVRGLTSNPAIFEKAIDDSEDYKDDIARLATRGESAERIYETLAVQDVQAAADLLLPVYRESGGADGFVSLEVSPRLARDTERTIAEAKRLSGMLERANVMIKVPGTREGLAAISALLGAGINVNVTLLFSVQRYREVLAAYLEGIEAALAAGRALGAIASVASFFLSRIDTLVDSELDRLAAAPDERGREAAALRGEIAIASARSAYAVLREALDSAQFKRLSARGAHPQRLLWASTGTKDPAYDELKYVEPLIGPNTVNTMPLETLKAYHEHGRPALRVTQGREHAERVLHALGALGIDLGALTTQLVEEGIEKFVRPYDSLLTSLDNARARSGRLAR
jgi:transaldolase